MADLAGIIRQGALRRGLDPRAVLAVASQEGLSGGIGDQGTSFGPFQLHYGGAFPTSAPRDSPEVSQAWASSPAGVNYALDAIAKVAHGLSGQAAVGAIVNQFERPADPTSEIAGANRAYGGPVSSGAISTLPFRQGTPTEIGQLPTAKLPGVVPGLQPLRFPSVATPDFSSAILSNLGKPLSALSNAIVGASERASNAPFKMVMPTLPKDTTAVAPLAGTTTDTGGPGAGKGFDSGDPLLMSAQTSVGGEHPTEGLAGFPAHDYFAKAGSAAVAPVSGKVIKLSGHDPSEGPTEGPHGPFGWSVYVQGEDGRIYYMTHLGSRNVQVGQTVKAGQPLGTVGDYARYGTPSHIHMGVSAPGITL
jgi:murein DD-endopeptidase MepM/ murein hydrolase activator NlpD